MKNKIWKTALMVFALVLVFASLAKATDYYKSTDNQCGLTISSDVLCTLNISPTGYCGPGYFYPTQVCSDAPTHTGCIAETNVTSCGVCGDCEAFADTCGVVACGASNSYGCAGVCSGQGIGAGACQAPLADGEACYCNEMCASGTCNDGTCYTPNLDFNVVWSLPTNGSTQPSQTITVYYIPTWYDNPLTICSLTVNESTVAYNDTPLINDSSANGITYDYGVDGYYENHVTCGNGTSSNDSDTVYFTIDTTSPNSTILDCASLDIPNHTYILGTNIGPSDAFHCIDFEANNITLNCNGFTISGDGVNGSVGIYIPSVTGAVVHNCIITDWLSAGIESVGTMAGQVYKNTIEYGGEDGIAISFPDDLIIHDNFIVFNDYGISIYGGDTGSLIYNNYLNNQYDIWLDSDGYNNWNTTKQPGIRIFEPGPNIGGNYWSGNGTCTGMATPCENFTNQTVCEAQSGCSWDSTCLGTPTPCYFWSQNNLCNADLGCSWTTGGYSDNCVDANHDGFCDSPYDVYTGTNCTAGVDCSNNTDYLPLSDKYISPTPTPSSLGGMSCTVMELVVIFSTLAIVVILALLAYGGQTNPALALIVVIPILLVLVIAIMNLVGSVC